MEFEISFTFDTEEVRSAVEEIMGMMFEDRKLPALNAMTQRAVDALNQGGATSRTWVLAELLGARILEEGGYSWEKTDP